MKNIKFEPATADRIRDITDINLPYTTRSFIVNYDNEDIFVVGLCQKMAYLVLFCGVKPSIRKELKRYRRAIILTYRFIMDIVKQQILPVYSHADPDIEGSADFLEHIGFTHHKGEMYKWHG